MSAKGASRKYSGDNINVTEFLGRIAGLSREPRVHANPEDRFDAAKELLRDALDLVPACPGGNIASWNIAEGGNKRFQGDVPILVRPGHEIILDFFCSIALLREVIDRHLSRHEPGKAVSWGHFIMGDARTKPIIHSDLGGTNLIRGVASASYEPREDNRGLGVLDVRFSRPWLIRIREKHFKTAQEIHRLAAQTRASLPLREDHGYILARVDDLVAQMHRTIKNRVDGLVQDIGPLVADVAAVEFDDSFCSELLHAFGAGRMTDDLRAVARQMVFHALACPCPDQLSFLGYVPDISYLDRETGNELSSLALQVFLPTPLSSDALEWRVWSSLVSMVGREKSVHDFSSREGRRGFRKAEISLSHELNIFFGNIRKSSDQLMGRLPADVARNLADILLALDYIDVYRRILGGQGSDALPTLSNIFTPDVLAETSFRLAYSRAMYRGWVPEKLDGTIWTAEELWSVRSNWLQCDICLPAWIQPETLCGRGFDPRATYGAFWTLFLLIGAQAHAMDVAFPMNVRDRWNGDDLGDQQALVWVKYEQKAPGWQIEVGNRGSRSRDLVPGGRTGSREVISSLKPEPIRGWEFMIHDAHWREDSSGGNPVGAWIAQVCVKILEDVPWNQTVPNQ